jgi:hypothetical protein
MKRFKESDFTPYEIDAKSKRVENMKQLFKNLKVNPKYHGFAFDQTAQQTELLSERLAKKVQI